MKRLSLTTFIVILMLALFSSCKQGIPFFGKNKKQVDTMALWLERQEIIRVADSLKMVQEAQLALELARQDSIRLAEEARRASKYHMIVGSFYVPENARNWADVFRQRGYNVQILQMKGSRFQLVSAESFSSLNAAFNKLWNYQESIMPDAWIYIDE